MNKKAVLSMTGMLVLGMVAGAGVMMNDQAYHAVKGAMEGGGTSNMIGFPGIISADFQSMDLDTAIMLVKQQRAKQLEQQLQSQLTDVQGRNQQIAEFNMLLSTLNASLAQPVNGAYTLDDGTTKKLSDLGHLLAKKASYSYQELSHLIGTLRQSIDELNASQQIDMLRLQSMTGKRNEAFDLMTNFVNKMQDGRSWIIGNMR